jgi:hypothetical protein
MKEIIALDHRLMLQYYTHTLSSLLFAQSDLYAIVIDYMKNASILICKEKEKYEITSLTLMIS